MAAFTYHFSLHCKGEKAFVNEFKKLVGKDKRFTADDYFISSEAKSPLEISFHGVNYGGPEFYSPFEPLMNNFTEATGKPLSFFFELFREETSSDRSLRCGYAVFENGVCTADVNYDYGCGKKVKRKLANWLGIESDIDEDAVDEDWRNEVEWQLQMVMDGTTKIDDVEGTFITFETLLAAASIIREPMTLEEFITSFTGKSMPFEEFNKIIKIPVDLKDTVAELLLKGYSLDVLDYSDDPESLINVLASGKGFSIEELLAKVAEYTAKDMPEGYGEDEEDDEDEDEDEDDDDEDEDEDDDDEDEDEDD